MNRYSFLCCVSACVCFAGCAKPAEESEAAQTPVVTATIDTVRLGPFTESVDAVGTVSARVGHVAALAAPSPTRVTKIHVAIGDRVSAGSPLIDFEQLAFDAAVASADAALRAAESAAARATRLVDAGVVPRKDAEAAAADLAAARQNASNARRARELSHLTAPFAGVVTRLSASVGASVDIGQALVEVTDPSVLDIVLPVAPNDAARVRVGQSAQLFEGSGVDSVAVATARVADVSAVVDSLTRGVPVRLAVSSHTRTLRIGETLFARLLVNEHKNAVVISEEAIVPTGEGFHVFVVDSAGVAHARPVSISGRADHRVWISEGLSNGERIVTKGAYGTDEGARVTGGKP